MKKIIDGATYDTNKAGCIGTVQSVSLYRNHAGRYFVYSSGGIVPGSHIEPLSRQDALQWAQTNFTPAQYQEAFPVSDDELEAVVIRMPGSLVSRLKARAEERQCSMAALVNELVDMSLK